MGGSYSASTKKNRGFASDAELLKRIRELQNEREKLRCVYERKMQEKETEWNKERRVLEEQVRNLEVAAVKKVLKGEETELVEDVSDRQKDDTAERWKKLYNVIKAELDGLILRTQTSGAVVYDVNLMQYLMEVLEEKENTIETLKAKIFTMEKDESNKAREVDILRQSLRIIMNSAKMSKTTHLMKTAKSLSRLQDRIKMENQKQDNSRN